MKQQFCMWELTDEYYNLWSSDCDQETWLNNGTPLENDFKYCPYCGKNIKLKEET
jgi:hypothetical protein